jgi:hypothetical protein
MGWLADHRFAFEHPRREPNPVIRTATLSTCKRWQVRQYRDGHWDAATDLELSPGFESFPALQDWLGAQAETADWASIHPLGLAVPGETTYLLGPA